MRSVFLVYLLCIGLIQNVKNINIVKPTYLMRYLIELQYNLLLFAQMGKQKKQKNKKDKKDKKKNKDKDKQRERDRKDKKRKDKKRSYSSSSSSSDSSDSSSSSRQKNKKKQNKNRAKEKKQTKPEFKAANNPYDFDKSTSKTVPNFHVGLPAPGFNAPILHPTPPPPTSIPAQQTTRPKTREINIFKLLPKLPFGAVLLAKTLYSTQLIQQKAYNILLTETMQQVQKKVKQQNHKKAINIIGKCSAEIQKLIGAQLQRKTYEPMLGNSSKQINMQKMIENSDDNRFTNLRRIYDQYFKE